MKDKLWGGRFEAKTDALVEALGESVSFDARLAPWDILGSIAHARMLGDCGVIRKGDARKIIGGLRAIEKDIAGGAFSWDVSLEDVHTNIEAALVKRIGDAGKRLHTGRSRNDQIATDLRLWMRDQIDVIAGLLRDLREAVVSFAEAHIDVIVPGYTHLQHAQPVLLAHHYLAYYEMFSRDAARFREVRGRVNVLPLGSAALAGTPYPLNRKQVARELGFDDVAANSMDAVSDRDFAVEFCSACALTMTHLSRLCEELVLWSTSEFGYIEIADAFTTGSSIMPQKKNPDVAELVRGKSGRVFGDLFSVLTMLKGLPLAYNRDLQEDKEPVFDASDTVQRCLAVVGRMLPAIRVNRDVLEASVGEGFMEATDLADHLVSKGVPFREAHGIIGRIVLHCIKNRLRLPDLTEEELGQFSPLLVGEHSPKLDAQSVVSRRATLGGTAPRRVRAALKRARQAMARD